MQTLECEKKHCLRDSITMNYALNNRSAAEHNAARKTLVPPALGVIVLLVAQGMDNLLSS